MSKLFSFLVLVFCICGTAQAERLILTEDTLLEDGQLITISGWLLRTPEYGYVLDPGSDLAPFLVIPLVAPETFRLLETCPMDADGALCRVTFDAEVYVVGGRPRLGTRLLITDVRELSIP